MKKVISLLLAFVMCLSLCACGNQKEENIEIVRQLLDKFETVAFWDRVEQDFQTGKANPAFEEVVLERISIWKSNNDIVNLLRFSYFVEQIGYHSETVTTALKESVKDDVIQNLGTKASFGFSAYFGMEYEGYWYDPLGKNRVKEGSVGTYHHRTYWAELGDFVLVDEDAYWYGTTDDDNGIENLVGISLYYVDNQVLREKSGETLSNFLDELGLWLDHYDMSPLTYAEHWGLGPSEDITWAEFLCAEENYDDTVYVINDTQDNVCLVAIRSDRYIVLSGLDSEVFSVEK